MKAEEYYLTNRRSEYNCIEKSNRKIQQFDFYDLIDFAQQYAEHYHQERLKDNPITDAVKYIISVWDEVSGIWREKPDHVQQKIIEAEKHLKQ